MKIFFLVLCLFFFSACGRDLKQSEQQQSKVGTTKVTFSFPNQTEKVSSSIMIFSLKLEGITDQSLSDDRTTIISPGSNANISFTNGNYIFLGYVNDLATNLTGTSKCGLGNGPNISGGLNFYTLDGVDTNVNITLEESQCADLLNSSSSVKSIKFYSCSNSAALPTSVISQCDGASGRPAAGNATNFKVFLGDVSNTAGALTLTASSISSDCIQFPTGGSAGSNAGTFLNIPKKEPMAVIVRIYSDITCTTFVREYAAPFGLNQEAFFTPGSSFMKYIDDGTDAHLYLQDF